MFTMLPQDIGRVEIGGVDVDPEILAGALKLAAVRASVLSEMAAALGLDDPFAGDVDRIESAKANAAPPSVCGPDIIAAPARGPMVAFAPISVQPKGDADWEIQHAGYRGRDAARAADAFDVMEHQARRKQGRAYRRLFSAAQVNAGRTYAALVERHDAGGVKLSSFEGRVGGGGQGTRDIADIRIAEGRRLDLLLAAIGDEIVFKARVARDGRLLKAGLDARSLVRLVCCEGLTVTQVIRRCGRAAYGESRGHVREVLAAALDRMAAA